MMNGQSGDAQATAVQGHRKPLVVCREILDNDLEQIAELESRGFERSKEFWLRGLRRAQSRSTPANFPRYGYMLESDGCAVGAILLIYSETTRDGRPVVSCNIGSWYVDKKFRGHGPRLARAALNRRDIIYTDISPAIKTYSFVERIGFERYCNGLFFTCPALSRRPDNGQIEIVSSDQPITAGLPSNEASILLDHARYGCLSMVCRISGGEPEPFIFLPFRIRRGKISLPAMRLIFCRDFDSYKRCEGLIGRQLFKRGKPFVILDANAPLGGLKGFYTEKRGRKYFRGPHIPSLTDLTYTELVLFGA